MGVRKLINRDGRKEIWMNNTMIAYVDPDTDVLFLIDACGHAFPTIDIWKDTDILQELDRRGIV